MASKEEIVGQVKDLITASLGVNPDEVGADSLDIVELVMAIEKQFSIEIPDEDAEKISTVQHAIDYINDNMV